ncbi:hypothetical protein BS47DRAFT_1369522 [Hydnum rufescens UP504]|uniref:Uncharacterized protein n=1 Tax=Hydnum rufescens UP504 TaxID=1448309 RepID=A0A9P6ADB5_9AGAM|nr:hypothetical protein BS47DRAFT_1369522 [Hydnum rufescens UP504]
MDPAVHMNDKTWYHTPAGAGADHATDITQAQTHHPLNPLHPGLDTEPNPIQPPYDKLGTSPYGPRYRATDITQARMHHHPNPCTRVSTPNQTPYNPCMTNRARARMDPAVHMNDKTWYHTPAGAGDAKRAAQAALFASLLTYISSILDRATDITQARTHHHPNPLHPRLDTEPNPIQPPYDKPGMSPYGPCRPHERQNVVPHTCWSGCVVLKDHVTDITQARMHHHPNPLHPRLDTEPNPIQPPYDKPGMSPYGPRCPHERQNTVPHPRWSGLRDTHHPSLNAPRPEPLHPRIDTEPNPIQPLYDKLGTSPYGPRCPHEQQNTVPHLLQQIMQPTSPEPKCTITRTPQQ